MINIFRGKTDLGYWFIDSQYLKIKNVEVKEKNLEGLLFSQSV